MDIRRFIFRNHYGLNKEKSKKIVNLEYWKCSENNLGDDLAPVIYEYMLSKNNVTSFQKNRKCKHLLTVGSVLGWERFDATVWGSGILNLKLIYNIVRHRDYRKYDIRAVRGPLTRKVLLENGYECPEVYGDPAILMPDIYMPLNVIKKYPVSIVRHISQNIMDDDRVHNIDIKTNDYRKFINELSQSEKVISSSLHGIILAETYGVPAVFLANGMEDQLFKFLDWYYATGRSLKDIQIAYSFEEALTMEPTVLPDLTEIRENLKNAFPYDLWN